MALLPLNDLCKIELDPKSPVGAGRGDAATDGILVALPEVFTHYGFYSFAFDTSLMADLEPLHKLWSNFIGKRVYWLALAEKGAILEEDGVKSAYVKLTSLIAWSEPNEHAQSVLDQHGGAYSA